MQLGELPADTKAIIIHVNIEKIKAMTHRQRTDLMGRLEVFLETELPAAIKEDITHYWDTIGFELPGTDWTIQGRI